MSLHIPRGTTMSNLTLRRMDAAIRRAMKQTGCRVDCDDRAIFLAGMKAAASLTKECAYSQDNNWYIRDAVKRLKKEIANAK